MLRLALAGLTLLVITADSGRAQQYGVREGKKIRIRYCAEVEHGGSLSARCDRAVGRVRRVAGDTLVINRGSTGDSVTTRFSRVTELEVSFGYKSRVLPAAAGAAAAVAGALVAAPWPTSGPQPCQVDEWECALLPIVAAGVGAVVGLILSGENWVEVSPDLLGVSVVEQHDGRIAAGFSVRF